MASDFRSTLQPMTDPYRPISPGDPEQVAVWEAEQRQAAIDRWVPLRYRTEIDVPGDVREWTETNDGGSLYLTGPVGSGKTHTAFQALRAWLEHRNLNPDDAFIRNAPSPVVWRATSLLDRLRPSDDNSLARTVVASCQDAALLVIGDLGAEKPSDWTQERLYEVIDERYVWCRPLIVTSNLPPKALGEQVGERVASRLAEMCQVVALTGSDRRRS